MSRHFFDCELRCSVRVRMGYDPEGEGMFLEVERLGVDPRQGQAMYVYTSMRDIFDGGDDIEYYEERLEKLGLVVPQTLLQAVVEDAKNRIGERCVQHFDDGRMIEPTKE